MEFVGISWDIACYYSSDSPRPEFALKISNVIYDAVGLVGGN